MDQKEIVRRLGELMDRIDEQVRKPGEPSMRELAAHQAKEAREAMF